MAEVDVQVQWQSAAGADRTLQDQSVATQHSGEQEDTDEEIPASPRDRGSERSSNTSSSFLLVQRVSVIFQLPDGRVLDKTFATLPSYAMLWKQVFEWTGGKQFQLWLDDVQLTNKNTTTQLRETNVDRVAQAMGAVPSVQLVVCEQGEEERPQQVVPAQPVEALPHDDHLAPWSYRKIASVCTATVILVGLTVRRHMQNVSMRKEKTQGLEAMLQQLDAENAQLRKNFRCEAEAKERVERRMQQVAADDARRSKNSAVLAAKVKQFESERDMKDRYINQLVKQGKIDALGRCVKRYQEVDLLFMVDCTASMRPHIIAVKDQIRKIVHRIRESYPQLKLNLGFLGYRDLCDDRQFESMAFSEDVSGFEEFVAGVKAYGGGDAPEDIAGAVRYASQGWGWRRAVRVLFHIADAPCHGSQYHDLEDSYPMGTSVSICEHLRVLRDLHVDYYFGRITPHTDKMVTILNDDLGLREGRLYINTVSIEDPLQIEKAVAQSVCTSIHLNSMEVPKHQHVGEVIISDNQPEWDLLAAGEKRHGKTFSTSIPEKLDSHPQAQTSSNVEFVVAPTPFAEGESRFCYWGVYRKPGQDWSHGVFKQFKHRAEGTRWDEIQRYQMEVDKAVTAEYFARKFNEATQPVRRIQFLVPEVLEDSEDDRRCYSVETVLPGYRGIAKYNDNKATWEPSLYERELGDFTRWTYKYSAHEYMVVDLQGVQHDGSFLLTDPAILHKDVGRFGGTNTGPQFMEQTLANIPKIDAPLSRL